MYTHVHGPTPSHRQEPGFFTRLSQVFDLRRDSNWTLSGPNPNSSLTKSEKSRVNIDLFREVRVIFVQKDCHPKTDKPALSPMDQGGVEDWGQTPPRRQHTSGRSKTKHKRKTRVIQLHT